MDANEQRSCKEPSNHELGAQGGGGGGGIWEKIDGGFGRDIRSSTITHAKLVFVVLPPNSCLKGFLQRLFLLASMGGTRPWMLVR